MFSLELEFVVAVKVVLVSRWKRFRAGEINVRQRKETVCLMCWIWRSNNKKQRNPLPADLVTVCDFLTEQFEDHNMSYSTINSYRSTLSSMLLPVDGYALGEHPIIVRLLKGMFHVRPPEHRYSFTWDVNILLKYVEAWFPLSGLDTKQLTLKKAALVALVSAQRSQTLSALSIDFMNSSASGLPPSL